MENELVDEIEVTADTSSFDIEVALCQVNIDYKLIAGVYIYADKNGKINVSKIGYEDHTKVLEKEFIKWHLGNNNENNI